MLAPGMMALGLLLLGTVGIGLSPIFVRLSETGPLATAFWRVALAAPLFWLWDIWGHRKQPPGSQQALALPAGVRRRLVLAGLLFAGDLASWHLAILATSVANATVFASFAPVMVTGGAWVLFGERPTRAFITGLLLALVGAACLVGASAGVSASHVEGDLIAMLTALCFGGYVLAIKDLRARLPTARLMAWSCAVTALALLPIALLLEGQVMPQTLSGALVLLGMALVSQVAGQGMVAEALGRLPASFSALVILLEPLAAALAAWIVLGEIVSPLQALGGAIVIGGIMVAGRNPAKTAP